MRGSAGQIIANAVLPERYRDYNRRFGKDEIDAILADIAANSPEQYNKTAFDLMQLGGDSALEEGITLKLSDFEPGVDTSELSAVLNQELRKIKALDVPRAEKAELVQKLLFGVKDSIAKTAYGVAETRNSPLAMLVKAKARGNAGQLAAMTTAPVAFPDPRGGVVAVPVNRSYAQGLTPAQYWASAQPARKNLIDAKMATRQAGALGKLLNVASMDQIVTSRDCETIRGIPVSTDDDDNLGSVLASPAGGFPAGTVITREVLSGLRSKRVDNLQVRSPSTCETGDGLCSICVGVRETGRLPEIGYHVGANAVAPIAERIAQTALRSKHGGSAGGGSFEEVERMVKIPKSFAEGGVVSELDGKVESIEPAEQGGTWIIIEGQRHYVSAGLKPDVKPGDTVEAGDAISTGLLNPADIVKHKGIGEGRRYFTDRFTQLARDTGYQVNRRNVEVLSRALIDNVEIDEAQGLGDHLQGDIARYSAVARNYKPRPDAVNLDASKALGMYLEQPALHYSIGTRLTPSVASRLKKHGITTITAAKLPPGFSPAMQSAVNVPAYATKDWMARLGSTYLKSRLLEDVQRGSDSDIHGLHPYPGLARASELGKRKDKIW
jgi:DNA-directed RNA polymerase subunit beta'